MKDNHSLGTDGLVNSAKGKSEEFASSFNTQLQHIFQNRPSRYNSIKVVLATWDVDQRLDADVNALQSQLSDSFYSDINWYKIPQNRPEYDLGKKLTDVLRTLQNEQNLFIFYYGGGPGLDGKKKPVLRP